MKEERLVAAFDAAEPEDAVFERVWDALEAAYDADMAAAEDAGEDAAGSETAGQRENSFTVTAGGAAAAKRARNRSARWIPAVAAVLVLAVGVGVVLGSGATKAERALAPDVSEPAITEAVGNMPAKSYEMDGYTDSAMPAPEPSPNPASDTAAGGSEAGEVESFDGGLTFLTGEDGRRYSARTLMVAVDDAMTAAAKDALCTKYGVSLKYDWDQWIVVELDHDATVDELAQLFAALSTEPGVLEVEYDWETVAF